MQNSYMGADGCVCESMPCAGVSLDDEALVDILPGMQHTICRTIAKNRHQQLLNKYISQTQNPDKSIEATEHLARLYSVQHVVATAWLEVLPVKQTWVLDDNTSRSALRLMLGCAAGPTGKSFFRCMCGTHTDSSHHAMGCPKLRKWITMRHDSVQQMVRYIFSAAGTSSGIEPQERHLQGLEAGDQPAAGRSWWCRTSAPQTPWANA